MNDILARLTAQKKLVKDDTFLKKSAMTEDRRKLIFEVAGDDERCLPLIHPLERLTRREEVYRWLIRNKLTGKKFYAFCHVHGFSWNRVALDVLSRIDKSKHGALVVGKDVQ